MRISLPDPVILNRRFVPLWVFIFGILLTLQRHLDAHVETGAIHHGHCWPLLPAHRNGVIPVRRQSVQRLSPNRRQHDRQIRG
jgi:hypothetical protein